MWADSLSTLNRGKLLLIKDACSVHAGTVHTHIHTTTQSIPAVQALGKTPGSPLTTQGKHTYVP